MLTWRIELFEDGPTLRRLSEALQIVAPPHRSLCPCGACGGGGDGDAQHCSQNADPSLARWRGPSRLRTPGPRGEFGPDRALGDPYLKFGRVHILPKEPREPFDRRLRRFIYF